MERQELNRKIRAALIFGFLLATGVPAVQAQTGESLSLWAPIPEWAYGYDTQPEPGDTPPIPTPGNRALLPGEDAEELRRPLTLEGSSATFSRQEIRHAQDVIDWFPGDYPPMADIIKYGPDSLQGGPHRIGPAVPAICPTGKGVPRTHRLRENRRRTWFSKFMICGMVCVTAQTRENRTRRT